MADSDPIVHIQLLDQKRELPLSDECCSFGQETHDIFDVNVQYIERDGAWLDSLPPVVLALFMPRWLRAVIVATNNVSGAEAGDHAIGLPVRMCKQCIEALPRSKARWVPLICSEPLYKNLFDRYPRARVLSGYKRSNLRPMSALDR
ncbi:MAG: hypothetical protein AAFX06_29490 [Planctomycetota bacterium]